MNTDRLKELNDWLDTEIEKYSEISAAESDIFDEACIISFRRVKEKINELTNINDDEIYELIPLIKREIVDKFIKNCLSDRSEGDIKFKTIYEIKDYIKNMGFAACLGLGFYWETSPEGDKYWREIYDNL